MIIDTTSNQYQQLYIGLATLTDVLSPRIKMLGKLSTDKQVAWIQKDPLLKRYLKMVDATNKHISTGDLRKEVQDG